MMILEKIAIFILFLGPLVFFHELGHYFFARLSGVRVEVFSIGFGPKIFKFKMGPTEYALSLIPLGGYVKMFGDDPLKKDETPESERKYSFSFKGKWARFWIVMGGPLANFILAYFLFVTLFFVGERIPEIRVGQVPETSNFFSLGVRSGDVIKTANGKDIFNPSDLILGKGEIIRTLQVLRRGKLVKIIPNMNAESFLEEFTSFSPFLKKSFLVNQKGEKLILSLDKHRPDLSYSLDEIIDLRGEREVYLYKDKELIKTIKADFKGMDSFYNLLNRHQLRPLDLMVKSVSMKSAAQEAGMQVGDVVTSLNGESIFGFSQLRDNLQKTAGPLVKLAIWRDESQVELSVSPTVRIDNSKKVKLIGVYSAGEYHPLNFVETKSKGLIGSFVQAFPRTWETVEKTVEGFRKLIAAEVSMKNIGGPLAIGKVASDSFNTSLSYFFQLMALISVNLGVINLFPIPVLDGGHIMFIFLELINGGPISRRKMEIAQQVGFSLLLMLMVGAIFNDVTRFF